MPGLFSTPDEVVLAQQQAQEAQARGFGALGIEGMGPYLGMRAGQALGGLFSGPNPTMVRSLLVQDALREVGQGDSEIGTPKYFNELTKALSKRNLSNDAFGVQQFGADLEAKAAKGSLERAQAINQLAQAQKALKSPALADLPEAEKFRVLLEAEQAKGPNANPDTIRFYQEMMKKRAQTETSPQQEWTAYLQEMRTKLVNGGTLSANEIGKAKIAYNTLVAEKVDPATGGRIRPPDIPELNPYTNFGIPGAPARTDAGRWSYSPGEAKPSSDEIKILSEADAIKAHLGDMNKNFNADYVGPLAGRIGSVVSATTGFKDDPKRADFIAQAAVYKNRLVKFITGAQMSEIETKRLINEIPDVNDPPATFEAKRRVADKNLAYVVAAYQKNMRQAGVRV